MIRFEMDHVALLVTSIEEAVDRLCVPATLSAVEEYPAEGTRELYVGDDRAPARLLLMQPIGPGPYERALQKRGEGLHHLALLVEDLSAFIESVSGTGWLLHPQSLRTVASITQIWLCRPGVRALIEVTEGTSRYHGDPVVVRVRVPVEPGQIGLLSALRVCGAEGVVSGPATITIGARDIEV